VNQKKEIGEESGAARRIEVRFDVGQAFFGQMRSTQSRHLSSIMGMFYFQFNLRYRLPDILFSCFGKNRPRPTRLPFINHVNHRTLSIIIALKTTLKR
jgi:hypothetical protein